MTAAFTLIQTIENVWKRLYPYKIRECLLKSEISGTISERGVEVAILARLWPSEIYADTHVRKGLAQLSIYAPMDNLEQSIFWLSTNKRKQTGLWGEKAITEPGSEDAGLLRDSAAVKGTRSL